MSTCNFKLVSWPAVPRNKILYDWSEGISTFPVLNFTFPLSLFMISIYCAMVNLYFFYLFAVCGGEQEPYTFLDSHAI